MADNVDSAGGGVRPCSPGAGGASEGPVGPSGTLDAATPVLEALAADAGGHREVQLAVGPGRLRQGPELDAVQLQRLRRVRAVDELVVGLARHLPNHEQRLVVARLIADRLVNDEHLDPAGLLPALELRADHGGNRERLGRLLRDHLPPEVGLEAIEPRALLRAGAVGGVQEVRQRQLLLLAHRAGEHTLSLHRPAQQVVEDAVAAHDAEGGV
mmetsp:Transcript_92095/g.199085  ORF Transcript_92095/g.199085 Transcript_92095/m.199085 type:complete len:213 (-) Transcript_92095:946-1584(-)